jgi:diguanylate cyclase (GGDEF)-like protein
VQNAGEVGAPTRRPRARLTLAWRLTATLAAMALLSSVLSAFVQERSLSRDLRSAAGARLGRAARSAEQLIADHLHALEARYHVVSGTPQLRATLEVGDAPTLAYFADQLREQQHAATVAFRDAQGALIVTSGDPALAARAHEQRGSTLLASESRLYAVVAVPLGDAKRPLGQLVAIEPIPQLQLARWSELCGAALVVGPVAVSEDTLWAPVRASGEAQLSVSADLSVERRALAAARRKLAIAGCVALAIAITICTALARSLVRPIRAIQASVDRVRGGDLDVRLASARSDEIGDVARGIDLMVATIRASHRELDARVAELRRSEQHLATAQKLARVGSFDFDLETGRVAGTAEFWSVCGFAESPKDVAFGELFERVHADDRESVREAAHACVRHGISAHLDHRIVVDDGTERFCHTQFQCTGGRGERQRVEGTVQDITDRRRADEQIRYLAYHDGLTGLGNRRLFTERMNVAMVQARRRGARLGVLFLDLDNFKRINDTLGHSVGDELLRGVADRLTACVRERDTIARPGERRFEAAVSRLGGDEFIVALSDLHDPQDLAAISNRILASLRRPFQLQGHELVIGASIGIAIWPDDGESVDALLSNADSAMYHAKSDGREGYQFYDRSMNATALQRLRLESRLRGALERSELELHFQPKLELASGRIVGLEALTRWRDADLGPVSPADFIPVAEQSGLIAPLGRFVLRSVCEQIVAFERALGRLELRVSYNVSAREFHPGIAREILAAISAHGVSPLRVQVEITESVILRDEESVIAALAELRSQGVSIALDDFGTGYSSLSYLRRLPVDTLKIDRSFVTPITRSGDAAALTRSIVAMGKALGLRVVAEGVESEEQRALLADWRCDEIQGFVFAPPMPGPDVLARLRAEAPRARA